MELTLTPAFICDILCLVFFLAVVLRYRRCGFLAGVVSLAGNLASVLGAVWLSRRYAAEIFTRFLRPGILENLRHSMTGEGLDLADIISRYGGLLPQSLRDTLLEGVSVLLDPALPHAAETVADQVVSPLMVPLISIVLFFVVYTLCRFLVSLLVTLLTGANSIPLAGSLNKSLGLLLGLLAGAIDLFLVYCALWSVMAISGGNLPYLSEALFSQSLVFGLLGRVNPFI